MTNRGAVLFGGPSIMNVGRGFRSVTGDVALISGPTFLKKAA